MIRLLHQERRSPCVNPVRQAKFHALALDAMGCQTAIAEQILARGGDYLLALKANHPTAYAAVAAHFDQHCFRPGAACRADCDAFDDTHGRLVRRRVLPAPKPLNWML
jgi:hypothetical protein